jgi:pimeloyl-ACP methyl ester carboxylesterase
LSEGAETPRIGALFLIATPYKGKDGEWGGDDFAIDADFADRLAEYGEIRLYHSEDDEFVPVDHVRRYGSKLPQAKVSILNGYGHQFSSKPFRELAEDLRR